MNKEIEIPEGYKAKIEGNKVVLIKKESKDEKIRKSLLCLFKHRARPYWNDLDVNDIIAWLENHTEATWTEEDESFVTHILPRIINPGPWTFEQRDADKKYLIEFIKRQKRKFTKEQKPAEWRPFDKEVLTKIKELIDSHFSEHEQREVYKDWLDEHISQPAEWSEEDKGMLNCIIATLCEESHGGRETNEKMVAWLDNKLKYFSPRPHWKPSNGQMAALYDALYKCTLPATLQTLYDDLEKLM